jgi:nicotinamide-nucleotide amidase
MKVEIVSIGDELLIGQTTNTNAAWMGQECSKIGLRVVHVSAISDTESAIVNAIDAALLRSDIVLMTGGLGPTKDDITKHTLCKYFDSALEIHIPTLQQIESFFMRRNRPMLPSNIQQAELPVKCEILTNRNGTAAGMWFNRDGKVVISMPGVPYEMKTILLEEVFPRLNSRYELKGIFHKTILTQGIGESFLAEKIADWEKEVRDAGMELAYLPSPGLVKLRITTYDGEDRSEEIENFFSRLRQQLPQYVFGTEYETLPQVIGQILLSASQTVGTVESCTAGSLAHSIAGIAGASRYFQGSMLTYSNRLKLDLVQVKQDTLTAFGAVSQETVEQMAANGREILGVDYCLSTSGILGPDGGTDEKPVGTVWIGLATPTRTISKKYLFADNRDRNVQLSVLSALNLLRCELLGLNDEKK